MVRKLGATVVRVLDLWRGRALALLLLAVLIAVRAPDPAFLETLRLPLFDLWQRNEPRVQEGTPVLIVDIDEYSLRKYGQWPWPRSLLGGLVTKVASGGPLVMGFDILFPEPDRLSPQRMLETYPDLDTEVRERVAALPTNDALMARALADAPVVLGAAALEATGDFDPAGVKHAPAMEQGGDTKPFLPHYNFLLTSLPELANAARGQGVVTSAPERDGIVRRLPLAVTIGDTIFPALSLEMIRIAAGAPFFSVHRGRHGIAGVSAGEIAFETEPDSRVWIHYSPHRDERFVSAADILDGTLDPSAFGNRIILFGSTGVGLTDFPATPVAARMPGVEIHAQLLETMIAGRMLARVPNATMVEVAALALAGLMVIVLVPMLRPALSVLPLAAALALLFAASWAAYHFAGLLADAAYPGAGTLALFGVMLGSSLSAADRARRALQADLEEQKAAAQKLEGELEAARAIQMGILPREFPAFPDRSEFDLHAVIEPARAVGGDLYDFAMVDENHLYFMIGDVSGKGVPASLFMALTKALYKSSAMRNRIAIDEIMTLANAEIARENPTMMFVTVLAGLLDVRTGELAFCNAGHDAPILVGPDGPPRSLDGDGGPPLCVLDDFEYPATYVTLAPGETIVLFTDGVTEALSTTQELYSLERVRRMLETLPDRSPAEIVRHLADDIHAHAEGAEPSDDITILAVRYTAGAS